jgi:hypothetical protein
VSQPKHDRGQLKTVAKKTLGDFYLLTNVFNTILNSNSIFKNNECHKSIIY